MDIERCELELSAPYTIAYETVSAATNLFVRVRTDTEVVGYGCAAPDVGVTGETPDACEAALRRCAVRIRGRDALRRTAVLDALAPAIERCPAAHAAVDMALFDLLGRAASIPVWKLLGGYRASIPTSVTLFIADPDEVVARARQYLGEGFRALKIKGGRDAERDADVVRRVRALAGPEVSLRFDANQGYDIASALHFLEQVRHCDLDVFEQPTPRGHIAELHAITRTTEVAVMADESLLDLRDAFRLARGERVDMVNIKLMKVGGIGQALLVNGVARAAGLEVMVGCMDESALAIAAGLHFALARPNVLFADLDGHLDLVGDPAAGAVHLEGGVLRPNDAPGLGVRDLRVFD